MTEDLLRSQLFISCLNYVKTHPERTSKVLGRDRWFEIDGHPQPFSGLELVQEILFSFQRREGCPLPEAVPRYGGLFKGKNVQDVHTAITRHIHELTGMKPTIDLKDGKTEIYCN
jgi:hypothetical protein